MNRLAGPQARMQAMSARDERIRRVRLGDLQRHMRSRYGSVLPDDDSGRDDLFELLLPISLGQGHTRKMKNAIETWAPWMSDSEAQELLIASTARPTICGSRTHEYLARGCGS